MDQCKIFLNVKAEVPKHDNDALEGGTVLGSSAGISNKAGRWPLEFEFSPSLLCSIKTFEKLNSGSRSNQNMEVLKMADIFPSEDSHTSESYFKTKPDQDDNNKNNASPTNINVDSDVNLFESKNAVTEIGTKQEKPLTSSENRRGALPLKVMAMMVHCLDRTRIQRNQLCFMQYWEP
ncbi:hypothetical protein VNO77_03670 [Canavalia gladiata]|uniref:Uncharacterized protein n=1 Tax=Canavalia gladiata TaxID=3824 RepID=A0AAN9MV31_CANGL